MTVGYDDYDYATVAYDASTGATLWVRRYKGPSNLDDRAYAVAVSPDGSTAFVTGFSYGTTSRDDYLTVAYDASTGTTLWVRRYNDPYNHYDEAFDVAASPDGGEIFVGGSGPTIAYDPSTGAELWTEDVSGLVAPSPDGSKVFIAREERGAANYDWRTYAYVASTGTALWTARFNGPANGDDYPGSPAPSPDGSKVFVTGAG